MIGRISKMSYSKMPMIQVQVLEKNLKKISYDVGYVSFIVSVDDIMKTAVLVVSMNE